MEVTARGPQWVFLSFGVKHHDIALIRAEEGATTGGVGPSTTAWRSPAPGQVGGGCTECSSPRVCSVKTTDHKVGFGLYFTDPDGNRFEFFHETVTDDEEGKRVLGLYGAPSEPFEVEPLHG